MQSPLPRTYFIENIYMHAILEKNQYNLTEM